MELLDKYITAKVVRQKLHYLSKEGLIYYFYSLKSRIYNPLFQELQNYD